MNKFFKAITDQIRNTEHALITFISAVIPWLVPLIPAYLTGYHVVNQLGLPEWAGWIIGSIVEGLGLASMSRTIAFWENNRKYTKDTNKMPLLVPLGTYLWYLVIVIVVNVLLEVEAGASPIRIWTVGLLATLSVPTAALISVTSIWTERLLERENQKNERKNERTAEHRTNEPVERTNKRTANRTLRTNRTNDVRQKIAEFVRSVQESEQRTPGPSEIANALQISKGYASETLKKILETHDE